MDVTPLQAPVIPAALPTDAARIVPQIQAQAAAPLTPRAVDPSPRSERGSESRSNGDKAKGGQGGYGETGKRGGSVNIRV